MTTNFRIALVSSLAVLAVACGGPMTAEESALLAQSQDALKSSGGTTSGPTYALLTTASESASPVEQSAFTINSTYNVDFAVVVTGALSGHNSANVYVSMPGGSAYQTFSVSFATTVTAGAGEQQAIKTKSGYVVWVSMPVAGTLIQQYNLTGPWTASVAVNGSATMNAQASFSLN